MRYGNPDRVPCFQEGIRSEVLKAWRKQGLRRNADLFRMFSINHREEIAPDLEPRPRLKKWPGSRADLDLLRPRLDAEDRGRLPRGWSRKVRAWKNRNHVLMLRVHRGFFLSMGVQDWRRFAEVMDLVIDDPDLVRETMHIQGVFAARLAERVLRDVQVEAAVFSEPIGGHDRPLISPEMYEYYVLSSYEPLLDVLRRYEVETIVFLTYANARVLLPSILKWGFNCLWACEVNQRPWTTAASGGSSAGTCASLVASISMPSGKERRPSSVR